MSEEEKHKKFDVIIGNPPYQEEKMNTGRQAKPLYNLFVEQAKEMNPAMISMITPSRWFAGGIGLNKFRDEMMNDNHIEKIVDYPNAKEVFPNTSISGGVNYFVWNKNYSGECQFDSISQHKKSTMKRSLGEFPVLVRYNEAAKIINKIRKYHQNTMDSIVSPISPYGLSTKVRGVSHKDMQHDLTLFSSQGRSYISRDEITKGTNSIDTFRVMIGQTSAEHAGEPSSDGKFKVLTNAVRILNPGEICTHSYIFIGPFPENESANVLLYLKTKFVRFLLLQALTSIHISKSTFVFVPLQDFTQVWNDEKLNQKYNLNDDEIKYINHFIKEMD